MMKMMLKFHMEIMIYLFQMKFFLTNKKKNEIYIHTPLFPLELFKKEMDKIGIDCNNELELTAPIVMLANSL